MILSLLFFPSQVSNWFINARVRLWKPMVEEVHTLEIRKKSKMSANGKCSSNQNDHAQTASSPSSTYQHPSMHIQPPLSSIETADCMNGVLLTLGLHQNAGIHFSEECSGGYLASAVGGHPIHDLGEPKLY